MSLRAAGTLAAAAVVVAAAVAARDATVKALSPRACETAIVSHGAIAGILRLPGRLVFESTVRIGSGGPALVAGVAASVGARVEKGEVLARLDDVEARAALAQAAAKLSAAEVVGLRTERQLMVEIDAQRERGLLPEAPDPDELLEGKAGDAQIEHLYDAAQISSHEVALALARKQLARRVVRAPMGGVVVARNVEPGESIPASPPGPPLFVLGSDPSHLRLEIEIEERYLNAVVPGKATFVVPAHGSRTFAGAVRSVVPLASAIRSPAPYVVVVDVPNPDGVLKPGMSATVDLEMATGRDALSVPLRALAANDDGFAVWLFDDAGHPARTPVTVGVSNVDFAEVRGPGIDAGRRVITGAPPSGCAAIRPASPPAAGGPG